MGELYFIAVEDVDLSAKTWYHALSLELLLDAGVLLESYETSFDYYKRFIGKREKWKETNDATRDSQEHTLSFWRIKWNDLCSSQIEVLCDSRPAELLPFVDVPVDLPTQDVSMRRPTSVESGEFR